MTTKEYLSQAFILDRKIRRKEEQLEWMKSHAPYSTPIASDLPKAEALRASLVERTVMRISQLEESIQNSLDEMANLCTEIQGVISEIGNPDYEVILEKRYLLFLKWDDIASGMGVCQNRVFQLHREALQMVRLPCYRR